MSEVTAEQVKEVVMDTLNLHEEFEPEEIDVKASLFGDEGLGLDSLDALQLAVAVDEKWGVTIDESMGETVFQNIQTIADHINANR